MLSGDLSRGSVFAIHPFERLPLLGNTGRGLVGLTQVPVQELVDERVQTHTGPFSGFNGFGMQSGIGSPRSFWADMPIASPPVAVSHRSGSSHVPLRAVNDTGVEWPRWWTPTTRKRAPGNTPDIRRAARWSFSG